MGEWGSRGRFPAGEGGRDQVIRKRIRAGATSFSLGDKENCFFFFFLVYMDTPTAYGISQARD